MQHESDFDDFSVMIAPIKKKVSLLCRAPVNGFNNIDDFRQFVNMLQDWIPALEGQIEPNIDSSYAEKVVGQWETEIKNSLPQPSPKSPRRGQKRSSKKPKTSLDKENL